MSSSAGVACRQATQQSLFVTSAGSVKRWRALALTVALIPLLSTCTTKHEARLTPEEFVSSEVVQPGEAKIVGVTEAGGVAVEFDLNPLAQMTNDTIYAQVSGEPYVIALVDAERVWLTWYATSGGRSAAAALITVAAGLAVLVAIAVATKESCPFIYSWDGTRWVFDAEPYGGATTKGLERADFSELEHLVATDGEYRLRITNEVNETQYTNALELWAVHHPQGSRVVADEFGALFTSRGQVPPTAAVDASGKDLRPWLEATDHRIWEHAPVATEAGGLRQDLVLTFPKPAGATRAKLIANVATGLWGSHMIRELMEMRGSGIEDFYTAIDQSPARRQQLFQWNLREELFTLQILVEEPSGWEARGLLPAGGPFIAEDRVVQLDLSRVEGDEVRIRLRPPVAFWALNSFAMDFSVDEPVQVERLALTAARTSEGENLLPSLAEVDDSYYEMPETGDWAELRFTAVQAPTGMDQTFILSSSGYYRLHLSSDREPDLDAIRTIELVPDATAQLAVDLFHEAQLAAAGTPLNRQ